MCKFPQRFNQVSPGSSPLFASPYRGPLYLPRLPLGQSCGLGGSLGHMAPLREAPQHLQRFGFLPAQCLCAGSDTCGTESLRILTSHCPPLDSLLVSCRLCFIPDIFTAVTIHNTLLKELVLEHSHGCKWCCFMSATVSSSVKPGKVCGPASQVLGSRLPVLSTTTGHKLRWAEYLLCSFADIFFVACCTLKVSFDRGGLVCLHTTPSVPKLQTRSKCKSGCWQTAEFQFVVAMASKPRVGARVTGRFKESSWVGVSALQLHPSRGVGLLSL